MYIYDTLIPEKWRPRTYSYIQYTLSCTRSAGSPSAIPTPTQLPHQITTVEPLISTARRRMHLHALHNSPYFTASFPHSTHAYRLAVKRDTTATLSTLVGVTAVICALVLAILDYMRRSSARKYARQVLEGKKAR
ncbi:hypothetical protein EJ03DRAFT_210479 [Teratosphaeria nubilosa]|uniref:Uncharacterized protein n=1 Tax=Teratosphaeria nubilosa TaxID=161662 RepID=A0A6G1KYA9_9PEZI|nr:hypothetical protein EJ03DRAFT_210479 [Teratosphaeria nubilosa]